MTTEELNKALYDKMEKELTEYSEWLKSMPTEEALNHTYEYTVRQDILFAFEEFDLGYDECQALLKSPSPMSDILNRFEKLDTGYMDYIRMSIEDEARSALQREEQKKKTGDAR